MLENVGKKKTLCRSDTDHSFYLLAGQIMNYGRTDVLERWACSQQAMHRNLSGSANIGSLLII